MFRLAQLYQSYLLALLIFLFAIGTTHFFEWGMAGLTAFILAYLTKGMRRYRSHR
jgi:hypothetical protein